MESLGVATRIVPVASYTAVTGRSGSARDGAERRRLEADREQRLEIAERTVAEARASSRSKDEFLAMLGHELRNSLSAVRNAVVCVRLDPIGFSSEKEDHSPQTLSEGRRIFRFETFGDEEFWTDKARLHEVIEQSVSPAMALKVGLKVDADAIPPDVAAAIKSGKVDLESPATTVTLLKLNAVVGLQGAVETADGKDRLVRLGITCALCHSTVDGKSTPLVLPPAYGLAKVKNETYTAEGPISYWNAYVAVTQMHGHGNFSDPRLGIDIRNSPDMVGPKLAALRSYQHSLETPRPPSGNADVAGAERGRAIFKDNCAGCHIGGTGTDNNSGTLHAPSETGMDAKHAARTANKKYRTTPLRALWEHPPYFHDGSAQTLPDVVEHYSRVRKLRLSDAHKRDLVEYLETL